jgi:hypothetical protein
VATCRGRLFREARPLALSLRRRPFPPTFAGAVPPPYSWSSLLCFGPLGLLFSGLLVGHMFLTFGALSWGRAVTALASKGLRLGSGCHSWHPSGLVSWLAFPVE